MELFIHRQNLLLFRKQLAEKQSLTKRLQLLRLLAEEEAKDQPRSRHSKILDRLARNDFFYGWRTSAERHPAERGTLYLEGPGN